MNISRLETDRLIPVSYTHLIMTTDTRKKEFAVTFRAGGKTCALGGIAKGSGMIAPNMATMLCFLTTDAAITPSLLHEALLDLSLIHIFSPQIPVFFVTITDTYIPPRTEKTAPCGIHTILNIYSIIRVCLLCESSSISVRHPALSAG